MWCLIWYIIDKNRPNTFEVTEIWTTGNFFCCRVYITQGQHFKLCIILIFWKWRSYTNRFHFIENVCTWICSLVYNQFMLMTIWHGIIISFVFSKYWPLLRMRLPTCKAFSKRDSVFIHTGHNPKQWRNKSKRSSIPYSEASWLHRYFMYRHISNMLELI